MKAWRAQIAWMLTKWKARFLKMVTFKLDSKHTDTLLKSAKVTAPVQFKQQDLRSQPCDQSLLSFLFRSAHFIFTEQGARFYESSFFMSD